MVGHAEVEPGKRRSVYLADSKSWIVRLQDVSAWFEMNPGRAPSLDGGAGSARILLVQKQSERFERTAFQAAKVRNVSRLGTRHIENIGLQ